MLEFDLVLKVPRSHKYRAAWFGYFVPRGHIAWPGQLFLCPNALQHVAWFQPEPCADVIVSAAARRSILVAEPKKSTLVAVARRRRSKIFFSKIPKTISFYPQNFLITFLVIKNCNKIS